VKKRRKVLHGWVDTSDYYSVYLHDRPRQKLGSGSFYPSNAESVKVDRALEDLADKFVRITIEELDEPKEP